MDLNSVIQSCHCPISLLCKVNRKYFVNSSFSVHNLWQEDLTVYLRAFNERQASSAFRRIRLRRETSFEVIYAITAKFPSLCFEHSTTDCEPISPSHILRSLLSRGFQQSKQKFLTLNKVSEWLPSAVDSKNMLCWAFLFLWNIKLDSFFSSSERYTGSFFSGMYSHGLINLKRFLWERQKLIYGARIDKGSTWYRPLTCISNRQWYLRGVVTLENAFFLWVKQSMCVVR